ncbi:hypothetical protein Csa_007118, partial [Cucumis sativus]
SSLEPMTDPTKELSSPIFLLSNICNLISICLDSTNFVPWKFHIQSILIAHKLFGFVDGSNRKPARFIAQSTTGTTSSSSSEAITSPQTAAHTQPSPLHDEWIAKDHALINATLSPGVLAYIVGCSTSKDI